MDPLLPSKECCIIKRNNYISGHGWDQGERATYARFWILKSFGATVLHVWPSEQDSWTILIVRGPEVSNVTDYNHWFLGTTLSANHNYNRLLCAHYLPADRADALVDTTNHCKSKIPIAWWESVNSGLLDAIRRGGMGRWWIGHRGWSHTPPMKRVASTHHQACRHLWISGTPGAVY